MVLNFIVLFFFAVRRVLERLAAFSFPSYLHPFPKGLVHHLQINLPDKVTVVPVKLIPLR